MEFFDSHAHYNDEKFNCDRESLIEQIYKEGITNIMNVGYNLISSKKAIEIASKYDFMIASVGISPNDIDDMEIEELDKIKELAQHEKVKAIGEIGLDYYWNKENKEKQQEFFIKQIEIANELDLPIIIHTREAVSDTLDILKNKVLVNKKGIFHCCPLNIELIKEALKLDFYISFAGPVTFKNSKNAQEVVEKVPLEKLLIETDAPYLSPEPVRGTRNDSRNVKYTAKKIAEIKGITLEEVAKQTYLNTKKIFNI
ncbi:MAG: TatD family deoxyribonuclease [Clostridiales bacterium]|nr:TatD family deoxyribonuclease [Clostridiales bacterium]